MTENISTIIIAFDGLDKELIEEFDLKNIQQKEFGKIDNQTGMSRIKTSELFASFVTGENYEVHGCKGIQTWNNEALATLEEFIDGLLVFDKFRGLREAVYTSINSIDLFKKKYTKQELKCDTFFEDFEDARAMFVPGYNPSPFWQVDDFGELFKYGYRPNEVAEYWDDREYETRKRKLFEELGSDILPARSLLMCHFHKPDLHQHMYGEKTIDRFDKPRLKEMYEEMDELAGEIKQKALEKGYERVIFMSDHGLPTETAHNLNAFYSCNIELFGEETPKITEFRERIVEKE